MNSAEIEPRGTPPYLLIMDLTFAALFSRLATVITDSGMEGVGIFFLLYAPCMWMWTIICNLLNKCDAEDVSFEIFSVVINMIVLVLAFRVQVCLSSDTDDDTRRESCMTFVSAYGMIRLAVVIFYSYVTCFVKSMRPQLLREVIATCAVVPFLVLLASLSQEFWIAPPIFCCFLLDQVSWLAQPIRKVEVAAIAAYPWSTMAMGKTYEHPLHSIWGRKHRTLRFSLLTLNHNCCRCFGLRLHFCPAGSLSQLADP